MTFHLAKELFGHEEDVRGLFSLPQNRLASVSRDKSLKLWDLGNEDPLSNHKTFYGHEHFVSAVTYLPESGHIATGGNDKIINIWDGESDAPLQTLIGHENVVCSLAVGKDDTLYSGSWDSSVRVWKDGNLINTINGHEQTVWSVLVLNNGTIVTGSADKKIKFWKNNSCVQTLEKHTDCVRGLTDVPGLGFLSCGNDGAIYLWSYEGDLLQEMIEHTEYIYSIACTDDHVFISGGEDRLLKFWKNSECFQTIEQPAGIWCISVLTNGDVAVGCSDGVIRIWSTDIERQVSAEQIQTFEASLQANKKKTGGEQGESDPKIGDLKFSELPTVEDLVNPGSKDGEVKVFRNDNIAEAHSWSIATGEWTKIGDVFDSSDSTKNSTDGSEYDYVFKVELDGKMYTLGYNKGENPYSVANAFLEKAELSHFFLDEVAQFIITNAQVPTIGAEENKFFDPFTGANRYIPGATPTPSIGTQGDPFTGAGRYIPGNSGNTQTPSSSQNQASVQNSTPVVANNFQSSKFFPQKSVIVIDQINFDAVFTKLQEFNSKIDSNFSLNDNQIEEIKNIIDILKDTSKYHASTFKKEQKDILISLLNWPKEFIFPVLDIIRIAVLHPNFAFFAASLQPNFFKKILEIQLDIPANQLLILRILTNVFRHEKLKNAFLIINQESNGIILDSIGNLSQANKAIRTAAASLLINFSLYFNTNSDSELKYKALATLPLLLTETEEDDILLRLLVFLGTVMTNEQNKIDFFNTKPDLTAELIQIVQNQIQSNDQKVQNCKNDLISLFQM